MARPKGIKPLSATVATINMLIVAESGWGKTVLAGTADQRDQGGPKALFLVCDPEGVVSAAASASTAEQLVITDWDEMVECYKWLRDEGHKEYQWVIVDSLTELQKIAMKKALEIAIRQNANRDPDVPAIQDYQKVQMQTTNLVKQLNDLPCNILYTALPLRVEDEEGETYYLPSLQGGQGQLAQQILGYMSVAGYGIHKTVKTGDNQTTQVRRVFFQSTGPYKAKDRFDALGTHKDNITIPQVEKLIRAKSPAAKKAGAPAAKKTAASPAKKTAAPARRRVSTNN